MTGHQNCRLRTQRIALLAIVAAWLFISSPLRAQSYGPLVDACSYNGVDSTHDVEQTVCLYGDQSELDASADTDSWAYEDSSNWPSGDLYVVGLGAQGQLLAGSNLVADTGMNYSGPYGSIVQANEHIPDAYVTTSITPQVNVWYRLNGIYSECYDSSDSGSDSCSWSDPASGLSVQVLVTPGKLTPTISVSSSVAPSIYGNPVTLTVTLLNEPDWNYVAFYDGNYSLGDGPTNWAIATNLVPYSQLFNSSSWQGYCGLTSNMTSNITNIAAPDGTDSATQFVSPSTYACGSGASWGVYTSIPGGLQAGQSYTSSVWLRGASGGEAVNFGLNDCSTSEVTLTTSWQRYTLTFPAIPSSTANCGTGTHGFEVIDFTPGSTFYVWGAQTEQASAAGPYIATGASAQSGLSYEATFTTSSLSVGNHTITASWPGDANTYAATSSPLTQVVVPITYDSGNVTLTIDGTSQVTSFGQGSSAASIANSLAAAFASNSEVSVKAYGGLLSITGTQTGTVSDYPYSLAISYNFGTFSSPSFYASPASGSLSGGGTGVQVPIYSYHAEGGYDTNGNVLAYADSVMGNWQFGYDQLNRLVTATNTAMPPPSSLNPPTPSWGPNLCWAYDSFGNRLQQSTSDMAFSWSAGTCTFNGAQYPNTVATYNAQNQMTSTKASGVSITPTYDPAGDVINDLNNAYLYDAEGRICAVITLSSGEYGYLYDAAGNRVAKGTITSWSCDITTNGFQQTEGYVAGPSGEQLTEVDAADVTTTNPSGWAHTNVYAGGKLIGTYDGDANAPSLHLHFDDPLGTRRAQASSAGVLEAVYQSLPFGDGYAANSTVNDPTENHFTGKERDTESGNDYFMARYYNSATGRFLSPDWSAKVEPVPYSKLDNPQTLNLYSYVYNNPLNKIDVDGHAGCTVDGAPINCNQVSSEAFEQLPDSPAGLGAGWNDVTPHPPGLAPERQGKIPKRFRGPKGSEVEFDPATPGAKAGTHGSKDHWHEVDETGHRVGDYLLPGARVPGPDGEPAKPAPTTEPTPAGSSESPLSLPAPDPATVKKTATGLTAAGVIGIIIFDAIRFLAGSD